MGSAGRRGLSSAARAVESGRRAAAGDLRVEAENARREGAPLLLPVEAVGARPGVDLRPVDEGHVASLMESIRALGLIQPVCVDRAHRLVAGAHRLEAYRRLAAEDPGRWGRVPVVVDPDLDAADDPERALLKELAENEKRRDLTSAQVQEAARRLMAFDASFTRRAGRLREGERAVTPFLASAFGVSVRHVRSLLNAPEGGGAAALAG
ncbi:MAG: chromosome partitioning protein ParB, partial [Deltaproteobacteria bacterium]|nr:chromosome partitioning protein ParB [Deltaproteobacteria bacterium]